MHDKEISILGEHEDVLVVKRYISLSICENEWITWGKFSFKFSFHMFDNELSIMSNAKM